MEIFLPESIPLSPPPTHSAAPPDGQRGNIPSPQSRQETSQSPVMRRRNGGSREDQKDRTRRRVPVRIFPGGFPSPLHGGGGEGLAMRNCIKLFACFFLIACNCIALDLFCVYSNSLLGFISCYNHKHVLDLDLENLDYQGR